MPKATEKKNTADLQSRVDELNISLRNFRFGIAGSKVRNMREGKNIKKEIARIKTELRLRKQST